MIKQIFITLLCFQIFISCESPQINYETGIIKDSIETYYIVDTNFGSETISYTLKSDMQNLHTKPYSMSLNYEDKKWKIGFSTTHYTSYPEYISSDKAILKIDDYKITYDLITYSESKGHEGVKGFEDDRTLVIYQTLNNSLNDFELLNKLSKANKVSFTMLGSEKIEVIWTPKIKEDATRILKMYEKLKKIKPTF